MKANGAWNFQKGSSENDATFVDVINDKDNPVTIEQNAVINIDFLQTNVAVTTTEQEVKVGANRLECRKSIRIYNGSGDTIYWGPSGVSDTTGEPLRKRQSVTIAAGPDLAVFIIADSTTSNEVILMEFS